MNAFVSFCLLGKFYLILFLHLFSLFYIKEIFNEFIITSLLENTCLLVPFKLLLQRNIQKTKKLRLQFKIIQLSYLQISFRFIVKFSVSEVLNLNFLILFNKYIFQCLKISKRNFFKQMSLFRFYFVLLFLNIYSGNHN